MPGEICYRGRTVGAADIEFINELIAQNPGASRRRLSALLCQAWNWVQPNGVLRDMVCRGLMLQLHRAGLIQLPPKRFSTHNPLAQRRKPQLVLPIGWSPVESSLKELGPLEIVQVRRRQGERLFASLLESYHYLGYTQPVGEHLKYLVWAGANPIACLGWSSAPRHSGPRDRFIGWDKEQRRANIRFVAYNIRFLIMPWVKVPHLASHLLGAIARRISRDWQQLYAHQIYLLETFVDPERFRGTCYRAANWQFLGRTTGRGKADQTHQPNRSLKELWVYPLHRNFRLRLSQDHGQSKTA